MRIRVRCGWLGLALILGCDADPAIGPPAKRVLLVSLDTTRADRIGAYGHAAARTPTLDRLAREGLLFEWALAPTPVTLPSHASLLTGVYPPVHGVRDNALFSLGPEARLVSEVFRERGWRTAAFVGSFVLDARFGLDQGFEVYRAPDPGRNLSVPERPANRVVDDAEGWFAGLPAEASAFAWVHFIDPHAPYAAPPPWNERLDDPYDAEIAFADAQLGRLLRFLEERGLDRDLLVVVTADHGESLGEHGEPTHGLFVYNSTVRVPLLVWGEPLGKRGGRRLAEPVSLVDVPPTLLALAGIAPEALGTAGRSLVPPAGEVETAARPVYLESLAPYHSFGWRGVRGLVADGHKLILGGDPQLYRAGDVEEVEDLAAARPELTRELAARLEQLLAGQAAQGWAHARSPSREEGELLAALGYTPGDAARGDPFDPALPDTRDRVEQFARFSAAGATIAAFVANEGSGSEATAWQREERLRRERAQLEPVAAELRALHAEDPDNPRVLDVLGFVERRLQRPEAAIPLLERAAALSPGQAAVHHNLAQAYADAGRFDDAVREARRAIEIEPRQAAFYVWLAAHHGNAGNLARAAWWVNEGLARAVHDSSLYPRLEAFKAHVGPELHRLGREPAAPPDLAGAAPEP